MVRLVVYIPERQMKELEAIHNTLELHVSEIVRRAIDEYIERVKRKTKIKKEVEKDEADDKKAKTAGNGEKQGVVREGSAHKRSFWDRFRI